MKALRVERLSDDLSGVALCGLDASGKPVPGADGKPLKAMDPRVPPGGSIGEGGVILDANGNPVIDPATEALVGRRAQVSAPELDEVLTRVNAVGHAKPLVGPTCRVTTNVPHGKAANLPKSFSLLAAMQ